MERALRLNATALIQSWRKRHPELWARWDAFGDAALLPALAPLTRAAAAGEIGVVLALHGPRAAAALPDGRSAALVIAPTNIRGCAGGGSARAAAESARRSTCRTVRWSFYRGRRTGYANARRPRARRSGRRGGRGSCARLGERPAPPPSGPLPGRPLGMHAATYERLCAATRGAEGRALSCPAHLLARVEAPGA